MPAVLQVQWARHSGTRAGLCSGLVQEAMLVLAHEADHCPRSNREDVPRLCLQGMALFRFYVDVTF